MSKWPDLDDDQREALINAFTDGELSPAEAADLEAAARGDRELADALEEARHLRQLLQGMPRRKAPLRLRRRLLAVPDRSPPRLFAAWWPRIALVAGLFAVMLLLDRPGPAQPSPAEIEQGRRDLALALGYLRRAGDRTRLEIDTRLDASVLEPITDHTAELLIRTPVLNEEYQL